MPAPFGILNINKPAEWTSRDVVNRVERLTKPAKAGHAGTLDPMAVGVLVVCVGQATRLIQYVQDGQKEYLAKFQLGARSNTDDSTGEVEQVLVERPPEHAAIAQLLPQFTGIIWQTPPQFSAVHLQGQRAYDLARRGQAVEIEPRQVQIDHLEILSYAWPNLELLISCGSGTYVRSLGRDLGVKLGCGAMMTGLVRTRVGPFLLKDAINLEQLTHEELATALQSPELAVGHLPRQICTAEDLMRISQGQSIASRPEAMPLMDGKQVVALIKPEGGLAALCEWRSPGRLHPTQVFIDRNSLPQKPSTT